MKESADIAFGLAKNIFRMFGMDNHATVRSIKMFTATA